MRKLFPATAVMLLAMSVFAEEGLRPAPEAAQQPSGAGPTLLQRTRIHIASLIRNAQHTAGGAETRALATELLKELTELESTASRGSAVAFREKQSAFFATFKTMEEEIFPDREDDDLAAFRSSATAALADIADALPILLQRNDIAPMRADLADLQSRLQLVSDAPKLSGWIARFDAFTENILSHAVPADPSLLRGDIRALLENLSVYVRQLNDAEIPTGNMRSRIETLQRELETVETEEDINRFLPKLEELLTNIPQNPVIGNQ